MSTNKHNILLSLSHRKKFIVERFIWIMVNSGINFIKRFFKTLIMNIFYLDRDVYQCAQFHVDKHVIKMILEYSQILSTTHRVLDGFVLNDDRESLLYKATHVNHPSTIWCRSASENYLWLSRLLKALCSEYTYRYEKVHKCERIGLVKILERLPDGIIIGNFHEPPAVMPDEIKVDNNTIESYKKYYRSSKSHLASWKGKVCSRKIPDWMGLEGANE